MKLKLKSDWKKFDTYNHIISAIQTIFTLKSSVFSDFIKVVELNTSIRKNSSDAEVLKQIWINEEYKVPIEIITEKIQLANAPTILDFGANIGMASLYFKKQFPTAHILAFEPFVDNRALIHSSIKSSPKALWKSESNLELGLDFRDGKEWSVQVKEQMNGHISGDTLMNILNEYNLSEVDILKMDIEGSEFPVFLEDKSIAESLKNIKSIIIEIHDDAGNRVDLYTKIKENHFSVFPLGELDVFLNEKFITQH